MKKVYSVFDSKAEAYTLPFFADTAGVATRMFMDATGDANSNFCKYPEDYTLFEIGEFEERTGELIAYEVLKSLGTALEYVAQRKNREVNNGRD